MACTARELEIDGQRYARDRLKSQHELSRANGCVIALHGSKNRAGKPVLIAINEFEPYRGFKGPSDTWNTPLKPFVEA